MNPGTLVAFLDMFVCVCDARRPLLFVFAVDAATWPLCMNLILTFYFPPLFVSCCRLFVCLQFVSVLFVCPVTYKIRARRWRPECGWKMTAKKMETMTGLSMNKEIILYVYMKILKRKIDVDAIVDVVFVAAVSNNCLYETQSTHTLSYIVVNILPSTSTIT